MQDKTNIFFVLNQMWNRLVISPCVFFTMSSCRHQSRRCRVCSEAETSRANRFSSSSFHIIDVLEATSNSLPVALPFFKNYDSLSLIFLLLYHNYNFFFKKKNIFLQLLLLSSFSCCSWIDCLE